MLTCAQFDAHLTQACGQNRSARLKLIDEYDNVRRRDGISVADNYLKNKVAVAGAIRKIIETIKRLKDESAVEKLDSLLIDNNEEEIILISKLLCSKKIEDAIQDQELDENKIREIATSSKTKRDPTKPLRVRADLRKLMKQGVTTINLALRVVGKNGSQITTDYELRQRNIEKKQHINYGKRTFLNNGENKFSLIQMMMSAQKRKKAEIVTILKGLELHAKNSGLTWIFITLTAPPKMHPGSIYWDGTMPNDTNKWLGNAFKRALARLRTKKIYLSGFRVVHPHDDSCPHWHLLIFTNQSDIQIIEEKFRFQPEWKSSVGLKIEVNNGQTSASGYCLNSVINTVSSVEELTGDLANYDVWKSKFVIRSFSWFGLPKIKLWRDFRSLKMCPTEPLLAKLWQACNAGDGKSFIELSGGINIMQKDRPILSQTISQKSTKTIRFTIKNSGKYFDFILNKYK